MAVEIPLSRGLVALVDDEDAEGVNRFKWYALNPKPDVFYAMTWVQGTFRRRALLMHRLIMAAPDGFDVNHWSDDKLDNRRANLCIATKCQNSQYRKKHRQNSTGYKGVSRYGRRFIAQIMADRQPYKLGVFDTAEEAHQAYCRAAAELHGEFARVA